MAREYVHITEEIRHFLGLRLKKKPLKRHMLGFEAEFMILDSRGRIDHAADAVLKKTNAAKKECARNMLEIDAYPSAGAAGTMHNLLERTGTVLGALEKTDRRLYGYATYPGAFNPSMRRDPSYAVKERIFGREKFKIAGRCVGFHCHYTLPRGIFDAVSKHLKMYINSKISQSAIGIYNMLIALDPALATFAQSSPFYQGRRYGKDARMMFYRGDPIFGVDGLYSDFQYFGGLPQYKHTLADMLHLAEDRFNEWSGLVRTLEINVKTLALYGSVLDTNWSPVKINPHGTFEARGMDMNRLGILFSIGIALHHVLQRIHEDYIEVKDSDIAIREPFKVEGNTVYIPPHSYVNTVLQRDAALYGMDSPAVRSYCSRFLGLAARAAPRRARAFLPLKRMIQKKRTVSDEIIAQAKRMGYTDRLPQRAAQELALKLAAQFRKDAEHLRATIEKVG